MPVLEVRNLAKTFGDLHAVDDISFDVDAGEILVIVGGSGCGKTTTLRCIAGLEDVTQGLIRLHGRTIASPSVSVPPEKRGIGMVFQSYALWPHKTVFQNVAYGLEKRKVVDIRDAVSRLLKQVGLAGFEDRYPSTLSGGQQQRVALARSAILQPKLLLLDEPLSNLDAKLREQMRDELKHMIKMLGMTALHITHDQAEAMALADRIICMREGRIEQIGPPREVYRRPASRFVAGFIGPCSFLEGAVAQTLPGARIMVRVADGLVLQATCEHLLIVGTSCLVAIRPEAVELSSAPLTGENVFSGVIRSGTFLGGHSEYVVEVGTSSLRANSRLDFENGAACFGRIDPSGAVCVPPEP